MCAKGNKINTWLGIIVSLQTYGTAMVVIWIVFQFPSIIFISLSINPYKRGSKY